MQQIRQVARNAETAEGPVGYPQGMDLVGNAARCEQLGGPGPDVRLPKHSELKQPPGPGLYVMASAAERERDDGHALKGQSDLDIAMEDIESLVDPYIRDMVDIQFTPVPGTSFYKVTLVCPDGQDPNLELEGSAGLELLNNLANAEESFLYQVAEVSGTAKPAENRMAKDDKRFLDLNEDQNRLSNYSTTQRLLQHQGQRLRPDSASRVPLANDGETVFDGITTLHPEAEWTENGEAKPRASVVFHELWENWERTHNQEPYDYPLFHPRIREGENYPGTTRVATDAERRRGGTPRQASVLEQMYDPNRDGAHDKAVNAEDRFWWKSAVPGSADPMSGG